MKHLRTLRLRMLHSWTLRVFLAVVLLGGGVAHYDALAQKRITTKELCARFIKLGLSYREGGDTENALYFLNKGLNLARQTSSKYWEAASYEGMGLVYRDLRDKPSAIEALLAARRLYNDIITQRNGSQVALDRIIEQTQTMDYATERGDGILAREVEALRNQVELLKNENSALREEVAMLRGGRMDLPPGTTMSNMPNAPRADGRPVAPNAYSPLQVPQPAPSSLIDLDALENMTGYTSLEEGLKNPDAVVKLDLSNNGMRVLPAELSRFRNLQYLNLSRNQLNDIPREIGLLTKLQVLNLSGNQLDLLPQEIGNLSNLKQLIVSQNALKKLPPEIGKLSKLEYLEANENRLTQVPAAIGLAASLRDVALRTNFIAFMPAEMGKLKRLRTLDIDNNSFTENDLNNLRASLPDTQIISQTQQGIQPQPGEQPAEQQGGGQ